MAVQFKLATRSLWWAPSLQFSPPMSSWSDDLPRELVHLWSLGNCNVGHTGNPSRNRVPKPEEPQCPGPGISISQRGFHLPQQWPQIWMEPSFRSIVIQLFTRKVQTLCVMAMYHVPKDSVDAPLPCRAWTASSCPCSTAHIKAVVPSCVILMASTATGQTCALQVIQFHFHPTENCGQKPQLLFRHKEKESTQRICTRMHRT